MKRSCDILTSSYGSGVLHAAAEDIGRVEYFYFIVFSEENILFEPRQHLNLHLKAPYLTAFQGMEYSFLACIMFFSRAHYALASPNRILLSVI